MKENFMHNFCRILTMVCWYWTNCTFGLYPSIFWDTRRWIKSKSTIRSKLHAALLLPSLYEYEDINSSKWSVTLTLRVCFISIFCPTGFSNSSDSEAKLWIFLTSNLSCQNFNNTVLWKIIFFFGYTEFKMIYEHKFVYLQKLFLP
jgi:hypothetical protein